LPVYIASNVSGGASTKAGIEWTGLFVGWVRIRSGSIVGPTIAHAVANIATCPSVAARTGA